MYIGNDHTFVVCAYKESPYLETVIRSLLAQTVKSHILVSTSTPNPWIEGLCDQYELPLVINRGEASISRDWNYGYDAAETALVTIAHQDDVYDPEYLEEVLKALNRQKGGKMQIAFTDYYELKNDRKVEKNRLLLIKRILLMPLRITGLGYCRFVKRLVLSFGNPICCPAVTLVKENVGPAVFDVRYVNSCDYQTWAGMAEKEGMFLYIPRRLMGHRIHAGSTTTKNVADGVRKEEDLEIMCGFWPRPVAKLINRIYATSEKSNEV